MLKSSREKKKKGRTVPGRGGGRDFLVTTGLSCSSTFREGEGETKTAKVIERMTPPPPAPQNKQLYQVSGKHAN